ncbi:MAG TPA: alpha/beta fold hydrolase [Microthrixaceae bacterium]|nr:alpha/beta fold hydrolase [Microthrixaceae bacterium]
MSLSTLRAASTVPAVGATPFGPFTMRWAEVGPENAPRVLLLHGIYAGAHSYEWRRLAPLLSTEHRVRTPDLLGTGESDRPEMEYGPEIVQGAVEALIRDAGASAHVVASSLTGAYALRAAASGVPMASLTLITPTGLRARSDEDRADRSSLPYHLFARTPLGDALVWALTSSPSVSWFERHKTYRDPQFLTGDELRETRRAGRERGARHLQLAFLFGRLSVELDPSEVERVRPTVVWGAGQGFTSDKEQLRWREVGAKVHQVDSGLPQVEEPGRLMGLLAFSGT